MSVKANELRAEAVRCRRLASVIDGDASTALRTFAIEMEAEAALLTGDTATPEQK